MDVDKLIEMQRRLLIRSTTNGFDLQVQILQTILRDAFTNYKELNKRTKLSFHKTNSPNYIKYSNPNLTYNLQIVCKYNIF
jgi:hypothetical protein